MSRTGRARRAAAPMAIAVITGEMTGAVGGLTAGADADADIAARVDMPRDAECRVVVEHPAVGNPQRIAVGAVAGAGIGHDQDAPVAVIGAAGLCRGRGP